jgi:hypothetical protein
MVLINTAATIKNALGDGFQVNDFVSLFGAFSAGAGTITAVFTEASGDDRVLVGEEMFDLLTGTDETALTMQALPGLDGEKTERLLDLAKELIGSQIRERIT